MIFNVGYYCTDVIMPICHNLNFHTECYGTILKLGRRQFWQVDKMASWQNVTLSIMTLDAE